MTLETNYILSILTGGIMIRGIFILLELLLLIIMSIFVIPITFVVSKFSEEKAQRISELMVRFFSKLTIFIVGTNIIIIGKENLPDSPCLYVSNHRSYFDIIISMKYVQNKTFFVAKKAIGKVPILNFFMKHLKCLLLDRNDIRQGLSVILQAIEQVKSGYSCFIYPEGTRTSTPDHSMLPFKEGSFKIATKGNVPICPITIINSRNIYERQQPLFKKSTVYYIIDKPIYYDKLDAEEKKFIGAYCQDIIKKNIVKYKNF